MPNFQKPEDNKDLFVKQIFEVILPLQSNADIWNEEKFDVRILNEEGKKLVILREKI